MYRNIIVLCLVILYNFAYTQSYRCSDEQKLNRIGPWIPDLGNGYYKNPVIHADYSDPDVVRVGDDFYMTSSSFNSTPGLQILHSKDLVNWRIIGAVFEQQVPANAYKDPHPEQGVWAPSIRYHNETFYITYGDPDFGVYMAKSKKAEGPWEVKLVKSASGWIDVCPFWDDNGDGYIVHAYAASRAGIKNVLTIRRLSSDDSQISDSIMVIDGNATLKDLLLTIEGPKLYKKGDFYYIFAPAGGVTSGWQLALRSKSIAGPWEVKKVMEQGRTTVNGPHQGGWVTTPDGKEDWFIHFQDKGAYGRIVHLQPMKWVDNWPVIGVDENGDGVGEPVLTYKKPEVGTVATIETPQTSDDFESQALGLQWQWYANSKPEWMSLTESNGNLRLRCVALPAATPNYKNVPNLLLQKFCSDTFTFVTKMKPQLGAKGERAGVIVIGNNYAMISVVKKDNGLFITRALNESDDDIKLTADIVYFRVDVTGPKPDCSFWYSTDGKQFTQMGTSLIATNIKWIGAKIGLYAAKPNGTETNGFADVEWVNVIAGPSKLPVVNSVINKQADGMFLQVRRQAPGNLKIKFTMNCSNAVNVNIYESNGLLIKSLNVNALKGKNEVLIKNQFLGPGLYICSIESVTKSMSTSFLIH